MNKGKIARLAGFVGALGISAALVAMASSSTGAYFTDTADGTVTAGSGHLTLSHGVTDLNFSNLVPGQYPTQKIAYSVDSNVNVDVWLTFDDNTGYCQLTGSKDNDKCSDGGLGRYGHFAVANNNDTKFTSYNLANPDQGITGQSCNVNANGNGGSNQKPTSETDTPPYCGVPMAIKLASNLGSGTSGEVEVTFGVTGKWTAQNTAVANVGYHLVATQAGVRPDAKNF